MTTICFTVSYAYDSIVDLGYLPRIVFATPPAKILECIELVEKSELQGCPDFSDGLRDCTRAEWAFAILYQWLQTQSEVFAGSADVAGRSIEKVIALHLTHTPYFDSIDDVPEHSRDLVPSGMLEEWKEKGRLYRLWQ